TFDGHLELARDNWTIRLRSWLLDDTGSPTGGALALTHDDSYNIDQYLAEINYNNADSLEDWEFNVRLSYLYRDLETHLQLFPPDAVLLVGSDGNIFTPPLNPVLFTEGVIGAPGRTDQQSAIEASTFYTGIDKHRIRIGAGFKYFELTASGKGNFGPGVIDGTEGVVDG
ncbi:MAG: hypothetical protein GY869_06955, partial [Planctomycetes bacterium]|nr:hypothetical protein [Planctomycetota bacterium]